MRRNRSRPARADLEKLIPAGPVTPETGRQLGVENEIIATDLAGFPSLVRQRRSNKIVRLLRDGVLTQTEALAALRLKALAENLHMGMVPAYGLKVDCSAQAGDGGMIARREAAETLQAALASLPGELRRVAVGFILEADPEAGRTLGDIGGHVLPHLADAAKREAGKGLVVACCRALAEHFEKSRPFEADIGVIGAGS